MDKSYTIDFTDAFKLYDDYKTWVFVAAAILGLFVSYIINKKFKVSNLVWNALRLLNFRKLGLDSKVGALLTSLIGGFTVGFTSVEWDKYTSEQKPPAPPEPVTVEMVYTDLVKVQNKNKTDNISLAVGSLHSYDVNGNLKPPSILVSELTKQREHEYEMKKAEYDQKIEMSKQSNEKRFLPPQVAVGLWGCGIVVSFIGLILVIRNFIPSGC